MGFSKGGQRDGALGVPIRRQRRPELRQGSQDAIYEDMPGLDPKVALHCLNIKADAKPVKQPQRRFWSDIMNAIEQEVRKLIDSGFIREEQHPDWVANIVPVTKKNGSIGICIDFQNLNDACPK